MKRANYFSFLFVVSIILVLSCGTKKKYLDKEEVKTEITKTEETSKEEISVSKEEEVSVKKTDSIAEIEEKVIFTSEGEEMEIEADNTGIVTKTTERTDTGIKETWTGIKTLKTKKESSTKESTLKERITLLRTDSINRVKTDSLSIIENEKIVFELNQQIDKLKTEKVKKTGSFFVIGFFILLLLLILLLLWINRKRIMKLARGSPI